MKISKRRLQRIIREERRKLFEDSIDDELDNLKKNVHDDIEHIKDLKKDVEDDRDEEERARDHERKDESRRRRGRKVGYTALRRMIREEHSDWGMGHDEDSRTHPGEKDYTGHAGDESKTHPGETDYADDPEGRAHDAIAAIHDLASAAGVELDVTAGGAEEDLGDVGLEVALAERALKRRLRRKIREATRKNSRRRTARRRR